MDVPCSNHGSEQQQPCSAKGRYACKNCMLVAYCSAACQKAHWPAHKKDCTSEMISMWWKPGWLKDKRIPAFVGPRGISHYGGEKFFWSGSAAYDILKLDKNEGLNYNKDLSLLFAASEDLGNVIMTVINVPDSYKKKLRIVVNDFEFHITARNIILLLAMLNIDDADEAADLVTHLWYSSQITEKHLATAESKVLQPIKQAWGAISKKNKENFHAKTWSYATSSLRTTLLKSHWRALPHALRVPPGLTPQHAYEMRRKVTLAPGRVDWRERIYCKFAPSARLGYHRFREDGLLLPFGADRRSFHVPNPTIYGRSHEWPMRDGSDPLDGWNTKAVLTSPCGPATRDRYGRLFYFLRDRFREFHRKIRTLNISFEVWNMEVEDLILQLEQGRFARIEMGNICDSMCLGIYPCLNRLGPLLQRPSQNRHATMIMVFLNAVDEVMDDKEIHSESIRTADLRRKYLRIVTRDDMSPDEPCLVLGNLAFYYFLDVNKYFDRYMRKQNFKLLATNTSMEMKQIHSIIDKWPLKLKKKFEQAGADEEFGLLFQSGQSCTARYVEWQRKE